MRDLSEIAAASVGRRRSTLQGELLDSEQAALRSHASTGQGGATIKEVLDKQNKAMRDLATLCTDKFRWIAAQSLLAGWAHVFAPSWVREWFADRAPLQSWRRTATEELRLLHQFCEGRLKQVLPRAGINNEGMFGAYIGMLANLYEGVVGDMLQSFDEADAETERSTVRKGLSPLQKLLWLVAGTVIGALITGHLKK